LSWTFELRVRFAIALLERAVVSLAFGGRSEIISKDGKRMREDKNQGGLCRFQIMYQF
jgi:hypothetical protein